MPTRSAAGTAKQLHLTRTARMAGEAFAFVDHEDVAPASRDARTRAVVALAWLIVGLVAITALLRVI